MANKNRRFGSLSMFPDCLKTAKVLPVHKSRKKSELCNYRPISILSSISKVLEKFMYDCQLF